MSECNFYVLQLQQRMSFKGIELEFVAVVVRAKIIMELKTIFNTSRVGVVHRTNTVQLQSMTLTSDVQYKHTYFIYCVQILFTCVFYI